MRFLFLVLALPLAAQERKPLIGVAGFMHESNSFNPSKTTLKDYSIEEPVAGDGVVERWRRSSTELAGFLAGAAEARLNVHPVLFADATPKGPLTDECYNTIFNRILAKLKAAPKLDGLYLALHGAMVVESHPHGD